MGPQRVALQSGAMTTRSRDTLSFVLTCLALGCSATPTRVTPMPPSDAAATPPPVTAALMAASKHIAVTCAGVSAAFIECKKKDKDPAACLAAGDAVTSCVAGL